MGWYRPIGSDGLVWRDAVSGPGDGIIAAPAPVGSVEWAHIPTGAPMVDTDPAPAGHHDTSRTTRDRAYHLLRESGMPRDEARSVAHEATDKARRARGC